jgi:hypothetical protein
MAKTKPQVKSAVAASAKATSEQGFKKFIPYIAALASFVVITFIFFSPMLTEDKVIYQGDIMQWEGMSKEAIKFRETKHEEALWTNSMFGGMPTFQISTDYKGNLVQYLDKIFSLGFPEYSAYMFIACISFYILLLVLGVNSWIAMVGGIAFALSSYNLIILEAGHNTKMHAIALSPLVFAGAILVWQRKYLLGAALSAAGFSLLIYANHVQIAYYAFISLLIFGLAQLVYTIIKEKDWKHFVIASLILVVSGLIGVASNASVLWSTYEYGNSTIRGKSELTTNKQSNGGLDRDYAYKWSLGKMEVFTLFIADFYGGSSNERAAEGSKTREVLLANGGQQYVNSAPYYWGAQPFTSGPVYIGAILCFLFVLGLIIIDGPLKWWLGIATLLSVLLSFGHNLQWFSDLFFDYFPGYNKFRTVTMILVIAQVTVPLAGFYALSKIFSENLEKEKLKNSIFIATGLTAGLCLIIALLGPSLFSFSGEGDKSYPEWLVGALKEDRASLMRSDALRSFLLIGATAAAIWGFVQNKVSRNIAMAGVSLLILFDMVGVGKRYVNDEIFVERSQTQSRFQLTAADAEILKDTDPNYRVFNTTVNSFNDASTSYNHKSIGGYHAAKLRRYQELIEEHIQKGNMNVLNMLNTKYFIVQGQGGEPTAQFNQNACGNAWFADEYKLVANADEELKSVGDFNPLQTAIVDKRFEANLKEIQSGADSLSNIRLLSYEPNTLAYESNAAAQKLAVFSEIFYQPGWSATIDGKEAEIIRVNYVLRALSVPAGQHKIEFKFQPASYAIGEKIAMASSLIILLLLGFALFFELKQQRDTAAHGA